MGWFSPVKGSYPSLAQVDKTLPVKSDVLAITRGNIVALTADSDHVEEGVWKLANGSDKLLYVALQDYSDPTAGFAGDAFNPDPRKLPANVVGSGDGKPRITAISLDQEAEYETSVFNTDDTYAVGAALYVVKGVLQATNPGDSATVVGYVTMKPAERWINNAIAVPKDGSDQRLAIRTGANKKVLRFRTK
jgi:hypothetical protein